MPSDAMHGEILARDITGTGRLKPFGSALPDHLNGKIVSPALITERVRKLRGSPACPECGNRGPWQCDCPGDEE